MKISCSNVIKARLQLADTYPTISEVEDLATEYKNDKVGDTYYMRFDVDSHGGGNDQPCVYIDDAVQFGEGNEGMEINHSDIINEWAVYNFVDDPDEFEDFFEAINSLDDETRQQIDDAVSKAGMAHCCFNEGIAFIYSESKCDIQAFADALLSEVDKVYKYNGNGTITRVA